MPSIMIPLVKCKDGDFADANKYRAITLSTSVTKLFECVILDKFQSSSDIDAYQFGFKKATLQHNLRAYENALLMIPTER